MAIVRSPFSRMALRFDELSLYLSSSLCDLVSLRNAWQANAFAVCQVWVSTLSFISSRLLISQTGMLYFELKMEFDSLS